MLGKIVSAALAASKKPRSWLTSYHHKIRNYDEDNLAYPWLNSIFFDIARAGGGAQKREYAWGVVHGAHLAKAIGIHRISVIEFGVAGGNSLVALEEIAEKVESAFGVQIDVYGFDTGAGLPKPQDVRDLPNLFSEGHFPMDQEKLQKRLKNARLFLGLVDETVQRFIDAKPAPVAFIGFDLDLYSSTMDAFKLLMADQSLLLPRIHCHFDDILAFTYGEHNGERLAISEFNAANSARKISPIYGLKFFLPSVMRNDMWPECCYMAHILDHSLYGLSDGLVKRPTLELQSPGS